MFITQSHPTNPSSPHKAIDFKRGRVKFSLDSQTLTRNKAEWGKASRASRFLPFSTNSGGRIPLHPSGSQEKSDQWFLSFASVLTTSCIFKHLHSGTSPQSWWIWISWGEGTQKGRTQECVLPFFFSFFFFASVPSYSWIHWNSDPK